MAKKKYESDAVATVQQFAHAMRWADNDDDRLRRLRAAIQGVVDSPPQLVGVEPTGNYSGTGVPETFINYGVPESPSWYRTPEQQLERARQLWPGVNLPELPKDFVPRTETEVLLLHVADTFDSLWDKVVAPAGYTKSRWESVKSDKRHLRLAPNVPNRTKPVWLGFDPEFGKGERPDSLWGRSDLAASEVFSALIQFPDWPLAWFKGASAPNLAGYQLKYGTDWSDVPDVNRWDGHRQLRLLDRWAGHACGYWASPVVRECYR